MQPVFASNGPSDAVVRLPSLATALPPIHPDRKGSFSVDSLLNPQPRTLEQQPQQQMPLRQNGAPSSQTTSNKRQHSSSISHSPTNKLRRVTPPVSESIIPRALQYAEKSPSPSSYETITRQGHLPVRPLVVTTMAPQPQVAGIRPQPPRSLSLPSVHHAPNEIEHPFFSGVQYSTQSSTGTDTRRHSEGTPTPDRQLAMPHFPQYHSGSFESEAEPSRMIAITPSLQSGIELVTIESKFGQVDIPVDVKIASKDTNKKRKQNAGASARFRARRKEREQEALLMISEMKQQLQDAEKHAELLRAERDYFKSAVLRSPKPPNAILGQL